MTFPVGPEMVDHVRRTTGPRRPLTRAPHPPGVSVRRTTSVDACRPEGLSGPLVLDVRGRDLAVAADGAGTPLAELALEIEVDELRGVATSVRGADSPELQRLIGAQVRSGVARTAAEVLPEGVATRSLTFSALEDLGGALLVSGYALLHAGLLVGLATDGGHTDRQGDVCAGWARGGVVHDALSRNGVALLPVGPAAPELDGHHAMATMVAGTVRRRRRLDVVPSASPTVGWLVRAHIRDTFASDDGEIVMHEYLVDAVVDEHGRLASIAVDPRVLPWEACPRAVPSAQQLVGLRVDELPARVRAELSGVGTCTHLNSTLRALADVAALRARLD